jgi:hypothetical protein
MRSNASGSVPSAQKARYGIELAPVSRPRDPAHAQRHGLGDELFGGVVELGVLRVVVEAHEGVRELVHERRRLLIDSHVGVDRDRSFSDLVEPVAAVEGLEAHMDVERLGEGHQRRQCPGQRVARDGGDRRVKRRGRGGWRERVDFGAVLSRDLSAWSRTVGAGDGRWVVGARGGAVGGA